MEDCCNQRCVYYRRIEDILQGAMIVLVLAALLLLAFAPEENAGVSTRVNSAASGSRRAGSYLLNFSKQPAKNRN